MARKNSNAGRGGNLPRHRVVKSARDAWLRIVDAVSGTPWENTAIVAAQRTDIELGAQRSPAWYELAARTFDAMVTPSR